MEGCTCHVEPPCAKCIESYECFGCGQICHADDDGMNENDGYLDGDLYCDKCFEKLGYE
jgi:hypothetical protein